MVREAMRGMTAVVLAVGLGACSDRAPQREATTQPAVTQPGIDPGLVGDAPPPLPAAPDQTPDLRRDIEALANALESKDFLTAIQYLDPADLDKKTAADFERGMSDPTRERLIGVLRAAQKAHVVFSADDRAVIGKDDLNLPDPAIPGDMRFHKVDGRWRLRKEPIKR